MIDLYGLYIKRGCPFPFMPIKGFRKVFVTQKEADGICDYLNEIYFLFESPSDRILIMVVP